MADTRCQNEDAPRACGPALPAMPEYPAGTAPAHWTRALSVPRPAFGGSAHEREHGEWGAAPLGERNKIRACYNRAEHLPERRQMMQGVE